MIIHIPCLFLFISIYYHNMLPQIPNLCAPLPFLSSAKFQPSVFLNGTFFSFFANDKTNVKRFVVFCAQYLRLYYPFLCFHFEYEMVATILISCGFVLVLSSIQSVFIACFQFEFYFLYLDVFFCEINYSYVHLTILSVLVQNRKQR